MEQLDHTNVARISDLITRGALESETAGMGANMWFGTVAAPVPATMNDPLYVDIPDVSFTGQVRWGPCRWDSKIYALTGMTLPILGDEVLIAFDNRQQPWVVAIWQ